MPTRTCKAGEKFRISSNTPHGGVEVGSQLTTFAGAPVTETAEPLSTQV